MNPTAQRIAIAETCGIKDCKVFRAGHLSEQVLGVFPNGSSSHFVIPDYLNDLNAMHEAWKTLRFSNRLMATKILCAKHRLNNVLLSREDEYVLAVEATAAQRAEAFLRTVDKWDDSK